MQRAQSYVEYALIIATVAVLVLLAGVQFGQVLDVWLRLLLARIVGTVY